jgi:exodeoxyribonuclease VII small subunit
MATKKNEAFDFGAKLKELETISSELEEQELDLDRGISQYEAGMKLVKELKEHLETATNRVEEIKRQYTAEPITDGELEKQPRQHSDNIDLDNIPF